MSERGQMTDTPRMDAALDKEVGTPDSMAVLSEGRELERENARLRKALEQISEHYDYRVPRGAREIARNALLRTTEAT